MSSTTYITTSIPYVNAAPHLGHALELVQADALARYYRLLGHDVRFQTGTDENAFKNVEAARIKGVPVRQFVDANAAIFRRLVEALRISADSFVRTSEPQHERGVAAFWARIRPEDLYRKRYRGLYCSGCEDFYHERDLRNGRCPDHGTAPVVVEEENLFFRLSAYQERIETLLSNDTIRIVPATRKNEVLAFVRQGLQDISVSRPVERSGGWGLRVPGDPGQVIYVWIDALINYLSGLGFGTSEEWSRYWSTGTRKIHVIGKNVWKFHAIYWPALLLSAGLPLPDEIFVHGFVTVDGAKISKTLGNSVDPLDLAKQCGSEALRYYLLRAIPPFDDGDFSLRHLASVYNADLANGLGNLVSRETRLAVRACLTGFVGNASPTAPDGFHAALRAYQFDAAIGTLWKLIDAANQEIQRVRPWELPKEVAQPAVQNWLTMLQQIAYWSAPILPDTSSAILNALRRRPICGVTPLFPRVKVGFVAAVGT